MPCVHLQPCFPQEGCKPPNKLLMLEASANTGLDCSAACKQCPCPRAIVFSWRLAPLQLSCLLDWCLTHGLMQELCEVTLPAGHTRQLLNWLQSTCSAQRTMCENKAHFVVLILCTHERQHNLCKKISMGGNVSFCTQTAMLTWSLSGCGWRPQWTSFEKSLQTCSDQKEWDGFESFPSIFAHTGLEHS